jgi:hypothetical protein
VNASTIVATVLKALEEAKLASSSQIHITNALNLLANLCFQPTFRTWLSASAQLQSGLVDRIYSSILSLSSEKSPSTLSAGLAGIINILGSPSLRVRFTESGPSQDASVAAEPNGNDASSSKESSPIGLLLSLLGQLANQWTKSNFSVSKPLSELLEKALAIALNLTVDTWANLVFFQRVLSHAPALLKSLIQLVSQPALGSDSHAAASDSSTRSSLSPLLIERALGVLTRGLRREHNVATAPLAPGVPKPSTPVERPLRKLLLANQGVISLVRILTLAPFASAAEGEDVSAESVLAKLQQSTEEEGASSSSSSSSATPVVQASSANFRYTRLTMEHASVCLAVCMTQDTAVAKEVAALEFQGVTAVQALVALLSSTSKNIAGNACLCIDALCALPDMVSRPELSAALDKLLAILKDPSSKAAHQNAAKAAILIGRAPNNVERWTKMRGVEIISTVLKMK